jgi:hypothetical protein
MGLKLSNHFWVKEWFTSPDPDKKEIYIKFLESTGEKFAKQNIDHRQTMILERIRAHFNSEEHQLQNGKERRILITSGYRFTNPKKPFSSQHPMGRGVDFVVEGIEPIDVKLFILNNWKTDPAIRLVRGIEDFEGMTWVHIDVRNSTRIYWFSKKGSTVTNKFYEALIKNDLMR